MPAVHIAQLHVITTGHDVLEIEALVRLHGFIVVIEALVRSPFVGNIVEFWRKRNPEIDCRVSISPACECLGSLVDITIYRTVQECVSNAVRHARPGVITISIVPGCSDAQGGEELIVEVADDGHGMRESSVMGFGLLGMQERIRDAGGRLTFSNRAEGGLTIVATLPYPLRYRQDVAALQASAP